MLMQLMYSLTLICTLISVAFYTLLERKWLSLAQLRKGPNKVGYFGILQPFADAVKLFGNETLSLVKGNPLLFILSPGLLMCLSMGVWVTLLPVNSWATQQYGLLIFLVLSGVSVFPMFLAAWSCNSLYAMLGAFRITAQTISYEISLIFLIVVIGGTGIGFSVRYPGSFPLWIILLPICVLWCLTIVAETHRAPFDFAEGESELVSGYNIEYGSALFSILFLAEYMNILFMSLLSSLLFYSSILGAAGFFLLFLSLRASYPRLRYDLLMALFWLAILPYSIMALSIFCSFP